MKLRDRQEKLERVLAIHKTVKGSPFSETGTPTNMKGIFSVNSLFPFPNVAGIRTGVESKFIFQTVTREKDTLIAEFQGRQHNPSVDFTEIPNVSNFTAIPLSLSKVSYLANINHWLSFVAVPFGSQCHDFGFNFPTYKVIEFKFCFLKPLSVMHLL